MLDIGRSAGVQHLPPKFAIAMATIDPPKLHPPTHSVAIVVRAHTVRNRFCPKRSDSHKTPFRPKGREEKLVIQ